MAERRTGSGLEMKDKGKAKVGEPNIRNQDMDHFDNQTPAASQENQPADGFGMFLSPNENKESMVEYDQTAETNVLGPGSRDLPQEAYCLSKTLTPYDVIPENAKLSLDAYEASILVMNPPEIADHFPGTYSEHFLVFDGENRRYNMLLSPYIRRGTIRYSLSSGWKRFVRAHNLKVGDEITFYRIVDKNVSDDYYYILRYFRKPADRS